MNGVLEIGEWKLFFDSWRELRDRLMGYLVFREVISKDFFNGIWYNNLSLYDQVSTMLRHVDDSAIDYQFTGLEITEETDEKVHIDINQIETISGQFQMATEEEKKMKRIERLVKELGKDNISIVIDLYDFRLDDNEEGYYHHIGAYNTNSPDPGKNFVNSLTASFRKSNDPVAWISDNFTSIHGFLKETKGDRYSCILSIKNIKDGGKASIPIAEIYPDFVSILDDDETSIVEC